MTCRLIATVGRIDTRFEAVYPTTQEAIANGKALWELFRADMRMEILVPVPGTYMAVLDEDGACLWSPNPRGVDA